jgi:predicted O-linked N-acetylglucosamine transferase (SPINDLY family)
MNERIKSDPNVLFQQAVFRHQSGNIVEALEIYRLLNDHYPNNPQVLFLIGTAETQNGNFLESLDFLGKSLKINPNIPETHNNLGSALKELERFSEALHSYDRAVQLNPDYPEAHNNRGTALHELNRLDAALHSYDRAIQLKPDYPEAHYNRGNALKGLERFEEALLSYDRAILLKQDYIDAHYNRGIALQELKRLDEALQSYDRAIQLKPDYPEVHNNRGTALQELKRVDEPLPSYDRAIQLKPDYPEAHYNRGVALQELKRLDEALRSFDRAIQLNPDNDFWLGKRLYTKLSCCNWENFDRDRNEILDGIEKNKKTTDPFTTLLLTDSPVLQGKSARHWVNDRHFSCDTTDTQVKYPRHDKIRIGYFSADFHDHATLHLMAEMLEKHDRSEFELYGFSFGAEVPDGWRKRSQKCFDQFFDVRFMSDHDVAELARKFQIDIAVDLKGFTEDSRPNIFARRPAPVQVNYLGYPGTSGAAFIDYIIADKTIIPESDRQYYTEKVVYLPNCYQANCSNPDISRKILSRSELNLPQDGFVFCCFNNNNKINPALFDSWMRILQRVGNSVLWLFEKNRWAVENLRIEAQKRGVDAERLIFAKFMPIDEHLNRIRHADLFLDTLPYNAHTTASDALRMGVPLVTGMGNVFAGRVAASLLNTLDLSELITVSSGDYENTAVDLATDPGRLKRVKEKLSYNVDNSPLFNSAMYTRHLEKAYRSMYERYRNDLAPDHIVVES